MAYNQEVAQVNDRVSRLAARLAALDGLAEDELHPAVFEAGASAEVTAVSYEQLAYSRVGRDRMAAAQAAQAGGLVGWDQLQWARLEAGHVYPTLATLDLFASLLGIRIVLTPAVTGLIVTLEALNGAA